MRNKLEQIYSVLQSVLYDISIEHDGIEVVYYFDTDAVLGYVLAYDEALSSPDFAGSLRKHPGECFTRLMFGLGRFPKIKLLWPHFAEIGRKIEEMLEDVPVQSLSRDARSILEETGLPSILDQLETLVHNNDAESVEKFLAEIIPQISFVHLTILETLFWPNWQSRHHHVIESLSLEEGRGDRLENIATDPRFISIAGQILRHESQRGVANDRNAAIDAAALISLDRLCSTHREMRSKKLSATDDNLKPVCVRFMTKTIAVQQVASSQKSGLLLTDDGSTNSSGVIDKPNSVLRSYLYFLVRSAFPSLGWETTNTNAKLSGSSEHSLSWFQGLTKDLGNILQYSSESALPKDGVELANAVSLGGVRILEILDQTTSDTFTESIWIDQSAEIAKLLANRIASNADQIHGFLKRAEVGLQRQYWRKSTANARYLQNALHSAKKATKDLNSVTQQVQSLRTRLRPGGSNQPSRDQGLLRWLSSNDPVLGSAESSIRQLLDTKNSLWESQIVELIQRLQCLTDSRDEIRRSNLDQISVDTDALASVMVFFALGIDGPVLSALSRLSVCKLIKLNAIPLWLCARIRNKDTSINQDVVFDLLCEAEASYGFANENTEHSVFLIGSSWVCAYMSLYYYEENDGESISCDEHRHLLSWGISAASQAVLNSSKLGADQTRYAQSIELWLRARMLETSLVNQRPQSKTQELHTQLKQSSPVDFQDSRYFIDAICYADLIMDMFPQATGYGAINPEEYAKRLGNISTLLEHCQLCVHDPLHRHTEKLLKKLYDKP